MKTKTIIFDGIILKVTYKYKEGISLIIDSIIHNGGDIIILLEPHLDRIIDECEKIK